MDHPSGPDDPKQVTTDDSVLPETIRIETLQHPRQFVEVSTVFQQIWGSTTPIVSVELLRAISHAGGYVAGVVERRPGQDRLVGASVGFLGRHHGAPSLHSHITGMLAGIRSGGVGRAMKQHQWDWCAANDIEWITWTFDPLIRQNAWFNIEVLGAEIDEYLVDFYGPMDDAINRGDQTDRLVAAWAVGDSSPLPPVPEEWTETLVATPENVVALRRTDPRVAERWRIDVRRGLGGAIDNGGRVTGFTRAGEYVVRNPV